MLGVSGDNLETHIKFAKKHNITFPLISDEDRQIRDLYGRNRITYLIDKKGTIRFIQKGVPDNKDFLKEIRKLSKGPGKEGILRDGTILLGITLSRTERDYS